MTADDLRRLLVLAQKMQQRDLAYFAACLRERRALEQAGSDLRARAFHPATVAGQDLAVVARWQNWTGQRLGELADELARAQARQEESRRRAQTAAARVQALETLLQRAEFRALQKNRRRAEQNGVPPDA